MRFDYIQVSPDYLDDLAGSMLEWAEREDSYAIPQFLRWKGIGYSYMQHFRYKSELVRNTFDIVQAILHTRWLNLAMTKDEIPPHRAKVLMRYLRLYDGLSVGRENVVINARMFPHLPDNIIESGDIFTCASREYSEYTFKSCV